MAKFLGPRLIRQLKRNFLRFSYRHNASALRFSWNWDEVPVTRIGIINTAARQYKDCAYLEIGCDKDAVFKAVQARFKTGVDPVRGGTMRMTPDEFFAQNTAKFDVIFIDGLHTYEQEHKDVINSIKCLRPGGTVLLHNLLPRNWIEAHVPQLSGGAWTGDVWKVAFELAQSAGFGFKIVKADHGVGVFRILDSSAALQDLRAQIGGAKFSYFYENAGRLPVVTWNEAQAWILGHASPSCQQAA